VKPSQITRMQKSAIIAAMEMFFVYTVWTHFVKDTVGYLRDLCCSMRKI